MFVWRKSCCSHISEQWAIFCWYVLLLIHPHQFRQGWFLIVFGNFKLTARLGTVLVRWWIKRYFKLQSFRDVFNMSRHFFIVTEEISIRIKDCASQIYYFGNSITHIPNQTPETTLYNFYWNSQLL